MQDEVGFALCDLILPNRDTMRKSRLRRMISSPNRKMPMVINATKIEKGDPDLHHPVAVSTAPVPRSKKLSSKGVIESMKQCRGRSWRSGPTHVPFARNAKAAHGRNI
jgi:hypothetical protein